MTIAVILQDPQACEHICGSIPKEATGTFNQLWCTVQGTSRCQGPPQPRYHVAGSRQGSPNQKTYNIILLSYSINYDVYIYNMIQYPFWIWQCWYQVPDLTAEYFPIRHICSGLWTLCSAVSFQQQESHRCEVIAAQSWSSDIQGQAIAAERSCLPSWPALPKEVILHLYMCHEHLCVTISVR